MKTLLWSSHQRGKKHDYLAMGLDFSIPGEVKIDMKNYIGKPLEEFPFPHEIKLEFRTPAVNLHSMSIQRQQKSI